MLTGQAVSAKMFENNGLIHVYSPGAGNKPRSKNVRNINFDYKWLPNQQQFAIENSIGYDMLINKNYAYEGVKLHINDAIIKIALKLQQYQGPYYHK